MVRIKILWENVCGQGAVWATRGTVTGQTAQVCGTEATVELDEVCVDIGPCATLVHVDGVEQPFSFFLRDVSKEYPIYVPTCGAVVTTADDMRDYATIVADIRKSGRKSVAERVAEEPEHSYDKAAEVTKRLEAAIWLGLSKDMRIFRVDMRGRPFIDRLHTFDEIRPVYYNVPHTKEQLPEFEGHDYVLYMLTGRGVNCKSDITKRLEKGYLPILHMYDNDDGVVYHATHFVAPEVSALTKEALRGTDMYAADACGMGFMHTPAQQAHTETLMHDELFREEETVLYYQVSITNQKQAPAYAFIRIPDPLPKWSDAAAPEVAEETVIDPNTGFLQFKNSGRVCTVARVNGKPVRSVENALLVQPGETVVFEFQIPHTPVSVERAEKLKAQSFAARFAETKAFWENELAGTAEIRLPEKRIEEMLKAGLLHIDIGYFGKNPDAPVVPIVGRYTAIGTESAPGIQTLDSMGNVELAERALAYFVEKQHEDGFIQNFGGYMSETGSTLWTMGEHWRYTRDVAWAHTVKNCVQKAADYLIHWRELNMTDEYEKGFGYGMISGKIADPADPYHSFMLNAGTYAGLRSAGELMAVCGDGERAERYAREAELLREDIRLSFIRNMELSPVIPSSDGTWFRTFAPWTESFGPACLYVEDFFAYTHGAFMLRDMIGAGYLLLQGVIDPHEPIAAEILKSYDELLNLENVGFSQPYYSTHPYVELVRGDVKMFLKSFYNEFASLADRGTYTFLEHHFIVTSHKLHEETWFLMRCRWMLVLEEYNKGLLRLLAGVPRKWLEQGEVISVKHLKTYYGDVSYEIISEADAGVIHASVTLDGERFDKPATITLRIPHPQGKKAVRVTRGEYCPETETVTLAGFNGTVTLDVFF